MRYYPRTVIIIYNVRIRQQPHTRVHKILGICNYFISKGVVKNNNRHPVRRRWLNFFLSNVIIFSTCTLSYLISNNSNEIIIIFLHCS